MSLLHQPGNIIADRYRLIDILGQGGIGITYEAEDIRSGEKVALKALSLRRITEWKSIDLFEREAKILSQLKNPAIPQYIDYFQVDTDGERGFYIAQQLAPGNSLAVQVENGWVANEREVKNLGIQILEILVYLHELVPPVIHRDIKPQNIIRAQDSKVFLVDFGAVQDTYHHTLTGGSTVVGTYGYMAPEQFRGKAVPATDLYGLGSTLLFLLLGRSPADLPQRKLKPHFRPYIQVSKKFEEWLERILEPVATDRFSSAREALAVLQGEKKMPRLLIKKFLPPHNTPITLISEENLLIIDIPPVGFRSEQSQLFALIPGFGNGILLLMLWMMLATANTTAVTVTIHPLTAPLLIIFLLFGVGLTIVFLINAFGQVRLEINQHNFQIKYSISGIFYSISKGKNKDINQVKLSNIGLTINKKPMTTLVLRDKFKKYNFGLFLPEAEKEWLIEEITYFLGKFS